MCASRAVHSVRKERDPTEPVGSRAGAPAGLSPVAWAAGVAGAQLTPRSWLSRQRPVSFQRVSPARRKAFHGSGEAHLFPEHPVSDSQSMESQVDPRHRSLPSTCSGPLDTQRAVWGLAGGLGRVCMWGLGKGHSQRGVRRARGRVEAWVPALALVAVMMGKRPRRRPVQQHVLRPAGGQDGRCCVPGLLGGRAGGAGPACLQRGLRAPAEGVSRDCSCFSPPRTCRAHPSRCPQHERGSGLLASVRVTDWRTGPRWPWVGLRAGCSAGRHGGACCCATLACALWTRCLGVAQW